MLRKLFSLMAICGTAALPATGQPAQASFTTDNGNELKITMLCHGSIALAYGDLWIQVDPVAQLGPRSVDYAAMPKADFILITHEHHDHLDTAAIATLSHANTRIMANAAAAQALGKGETLANGDSRQLAKDVSVKALPAYNTTPGRENFHPKGHGNGYLFLFDGLAVYVAGDTENIPELANLGKVDIAFLPVNQPYTMTPAQCVAAARQIAPRILIPYHLSDTDFDAITQGLHGEKMEVRYYPELR